MRVRIVLDVDYDESSVRDQDDLVMALEREVERVIGDGMLTPSGEEIVDSYDFTVKDGE